MSIRPDLQRTDGSRALAPGSRLPRRVALGLLAVAALVSVGASFALFDGGSTPAADRYGQIPSWIPKAKLPVGRLVTASAAHPWLAIEGDTVSLHLPSTHVLVTAVGPAVPEEGKFPVPKTSPCSFTVTFTAATNLIWLRPKAFTILDELGRLHHPVVRGLDGGAPPARVRPGQTVSLVVTAVLPTGNRTLRFAPEATAPIVSWDFDVEID